jgi:hypothetical protein
VLSACRVDSDGRGIVSQADAVLLVETVRKSGLHAAISAALVPWHKPWAVHDPGKILLDVALAVALGGDCLADVGTLRAEPAVFGPVASDPAVPASSTGPPEPWNPAHTPARQAGSHLPALRESHQHPPQKGPVSKLTDPHERSRSSQE